MATLNLSVGLGTVVFVAVFIVLGLIVFAMRVLASIFSVCNTVMLLVYLSFLAVKVLGLTSMFFSAVDPGLITHALQFMI